MKDYYVTCNVGRVKYCLSFHDGKEIHKDGSRFYQLKTFSNKKQLKAYIERLKSVGYQER